VYCFNFKKLLKLLVSNFLVNFCPSLEISQSDRTSTSGFWGIVVTF